MQSLTSRTRNSHLEFFSELTTPFFNYIAFIEQLFELELRMPYFHQSGQSVGGNCPKELSSRSEIFGSVVDRSDLESSAEFDFRDFFSAQATRLLSDGGSNRA